MQRVEVQDPTIIILADGDTTASRANARGHLFEVFTAKLMQSLGFDAITSSNLNVSADGIELDLVVTNSFMNKTAICECKAYSNNVKAQAFTSLYGKLALARLKNSDTLGYLFVLPRLVPQGEELVREAEQADTSIKYINAVTLSRLLSDRGLVADPPRVDPLCSDRAIIIAEEGLYCAEKRLDPTSRLANAVLVWGKGGMSVPEPVLELLSQDAYAAGLPIIDLANEAGVRTLRATDHGNDPVIATVRGSNSDFEYQFPASPRFFVGRRPEMGQLGSIARTGRGVFVINAQSGWGKSSLALKAAALVDDAGGSSLVVDSRTAATPRFVSESLRAAALRAQEAGTLRLAGDASWASLQSSVTTLESADWTRGSLLVFFDQFENVFQDEQTTREFRDLALRVRDSSCPLIVGFAWKTDLVSWTESHPYHHRDDIRTAGDSLILKPLGARDVDQLLGRLERQLGQSLSRDLRQRIREYSQGLPWLFKKLGGHVIAELKNSTMSQEQLVSEALNVQNLFDADLLGLTPLENEAVRYIARFAPIAATDVTERYDAAVVQSLLDSRLAVAVGDKIDTYWDIFRDFLNTGSVPIEESYILRTNPATVGQLLSLVMKDGGDASLSRLVQTLNASENVVYNRSRELRLFGLTAFEPNRVKLLPAILEAAQPEEEIRRRVEKSLRRHKAYSLLLRVADRYGEDSVPLAKYARELPSAFPAVEAKPSTWGIYARAFALWFDYAGLAKVTGQDVRPTPDVSEVHSALLSGVAAPPRGATVSWYSVAKATPVIDHVRKNGSGAGLSREASKVVPFLLRLGLLRLLSDGSLEIEPQAVGDPLNPEWVAAALRRVPGGVEALASLEADPAAAPVMLGELLGDAGGGVWSPATCRNAGLAFRSWAKASGMTLRRRRG